MPSANTDSAPNAAPLYFRWRAPGKPLSIQINLDILEPIGRAVSESFRAVTARGSEIGGVLFGRIEEGPQRTTVIDDFQLVECEYARGPLYVLSDSDRERLTEIVKRGSGPGNRSLSVVGFFRSNTRRQLALDGEDIELFQSQFSNPDQVFLLVKPFASKAHAAGFFIWEDGKLHSEGSYREFPFQREELRRGDFAQYIVDSGAEGKPQRASVVPLTPRSGAPQFVPEAPPATPPPPVQREVKPEIKQEVRPAEPPVTPPSPEREVKPEIKQEAKPAMPPAAPPPPEREAKLPPPKQEFKVPVAATVETPREAANLSSLFNSKPEEPQKSGKGAKLALVVLAVAVLAAGGYWWTRQKGTPATSSTAAPGASNIALRVERSAGDLILTWNRDAEAVKTAVKGTLTILDGEKKEDINLVAEQVQGGSIIYTPLGNNVRFTLEITSSKLSAPVKEEVTVLSALRPKPMGAPAEDQKAPAAGQQAPGQAAPPAATPADQAKPADQSKAVTPSRTFQPPKASTNAAPLASRLRMLDYSELPVIPGSATPGGASVSLPTSMAAPPPPATPPPAAAPAQGQPQTPARTIAARPAVVMRKVAPTYPAMARSTRASGIVRVTAVVGADGKVKNAKATSGSPLLGAAAVAAVKQWIYQPATSNGQPVESEVDIAINFVP